MLRKFRLQNNGCYLYLAHSRGKVSPSFSAYTTPLKSFLSLNASYFPPVALLGKAEIFKQLPGWLPLIFVKLRTRINLLSMNFSRLQHIFRCRWQNRWLPAHFDWADKNDITEGLKAKKAYQSDI